jgi:hypothetical protein
MRSPSTAPPPTAAKSERHRSVWSAHDGDLLHLLLFAALLSLSYIGNRLDAMSADIATPFAIDTPPGTGADSDLSFIIGLSVERAAEADGDKLWTGIDHADTAKQYLALFKAGDGAALTGTMADVWGEHVLFTKQYQSHLNHAGHSWHRMTPTKFKTAPSVSPHVIRAAGASFALPGLDDVVAKQGWTDEQLSKAVAAYGQFVRAYLADKQLPKTERGKLVPSHAVDEVWHQHIRFQAAYRQMSTALLGGRHRFLHHAPHISDAEPASGKSGYQHTLKLISDAGEEADYWAWQQNESDDGCTPVGHCQIDDDSDDVGNP